MHISTFLQGGAGRIITDLIIDQINRGYNVICIMNDSSYPGYSTYPEYEMRLINAGVKIVKVSELFKREQTGIYHASRQIAEQIVLSSINLIHCHSSIPAMAALIARDKNHSQIPIIQTMHGWGTTKTQAQEQMDLEILSKVNIVIAVSQSSQQLLVNKGLSKEKIKVIYNGISESKNYVGNYSKLIRADLNAFTIGCIGTICEGKNQSLLLNSAIKLISKGNKLNCIFIGDDNTAYACAIR